ncbi:hypothetical protein BLA29_010787 [Euroglyphus maynei]|uniref:Uncharacterized protein n=1 Tax=Euroglyphus maynei TaxID=6958 RepID=A0A1Y3BI49_EURMA|nr:hypothetical protein BLA29_010787 [Euroglyphus maynei]
MGLLEPLFRNIPQSTVDLTPIFPYIAEQLEINEFFRLLYMFGLTLLAGSNSREFIPENLYRLMAHFPNTLSLQIFSHMGQRYLSDQLYRFDYGPVENIRVYGTIKPSYYNISKITNPYMILWHGSMDFIADNIDIVRLRQHLSGMLNVIDLLFETF